MKRIVGTAAGLVAVVAMGVFTTAQQADKDQPIKAEVNAFMDLYWTLFSAGQIDQLAERIYHPSGQLSNQGHSSVEQLKMRFPDTRKTLLAGGYGRSQMPVRNVCVLSPHGCDRERSRFSLSDRRSRDGRVRMDVHVIERR
jgi:hypothetical protein